MSRLLVSQADLSTFLRLRAEGLTNRAIAKATGWSYGAVQDYVSGRRTVADDKPPVSRFAPYQAPPAVRTDDRKHLRAVIAQGGFPWKAVSQ